VDLTAFIDAHYVREDEVRVLSLPFE